MLQARRRDESQVSPGGKEPESNLDGRRRPDERMRAKSFGAGDTLRRRPTIRGESENGKSEQL